MCNNRRKFKNNVYGKYYVSEACIGCMLCSEIAPDNFRSDSDEELETDCNYVCKQPESAEEEERCAEAMNACPANAIGSEK